MYYNERIQQERENRDLSQAQLSEMIGISQQQYNRYEIGKNALPIERLISICKVLNVSSDYLLGLSDFKRPYYMAHSEEYSNEFVSDNSDRYRSIGIMSIDSRSLDEMRRFAKSANTSLDEVLIKSIEFGFKDVKEAYKVNNDLFKNKGKH